MAAQHQPAGGFQSDLITSETIRAWAGLADFNDESGVPAFLFREIHLHADFAFAKRGRVAYELRSIASGRVQFTVFGHPAPTIGGKALERWRRYGFAKLSPKIIWLSIPP